MFRDEDDFGKKSGREALGRDALYAQSKFVSLILSFGEERPNLFDRSAISYLQKSLRGCMRGILFRSPLTQVRSSTYIFVDTFILIAFCRQFED